MGGLHPQTPPLATPLLTWNSFFYHNITHPSDHSHLCSLKCHFFIFTLIPLVSTLFFHSFSLLIKSFSVSAITTTFSFLTGQVSLLCSILLRTQLLYRLPHLINDIYLLVSNGTNCLNLFHPIRILTSTAASASPSTLNISPR